MAQPWLRIPLPRIQRSEMKRKWLSLSASRLCLRQRKGPRQKDQETRILALTATSPLGTPGKPLLLSGPPFPYLK